MKLKLYRDEFTWFEYHRVKHVDFELPGYVNVAVVSITWFSLKVIWFTGNYKE